MKLAALLLMLVVGTHYGSDWLALSFQNREEAARAIFYALRGLEGAALFFLVGLLAQRPVVWGVCAGGMLEESETTICRLSRGIANEARVDLFSGLCGPTWYWLGLCVAAGLAVWIAKEVRQ